MIKKNNIKKRGGVRKGAGAKPILEGGRSLPVYLDDPTFDVMREIGEGELSRGIRLAGIAIRYLPDSARETLLEEAKRIETESIERVRESQKRKEE